MCYNFIITSVTDNFKNITTRFKLPIALSFLGIILIIGGIFTSGLNKQKPKDFPKESLVESQKLISVDVSGAVSKPGVYQLKDGSRIEEAISAANGFSKTANKEYISKYLNMAQKLSDGSKIYVPIVGDNAPPPVGSTSIQSKVNINTASQSELEALPDIGPVTATKIISARPYQALEELTSKKVVNKTVYEKIKDVIVVY